MIAWRRRANSAVKQRNEELRSRLSVTRKRIRQIEASEAEPEVAELPRQLNFRYHPARAEGEFARGDDDFGSL
jgi:hypothetical protein